MYKNIALPPHAVVLDTPDPKCKPHIVIKGIEYKHCSFCDSWHPISDFWNYASHWDGLQCHCKECVLTENIQSVLRKHL